jgi:hypothetical protein
MVAGNPQLDFHRVKPGASPGKSDEGNLAGTASLPDPWRVDAQLFRDLVHIKEIPHALSVRQ